MMLVMMLVLMMMKVLILMLVMMLVMMLKLMTSKGNDDVNSRLGVLPCWLTVDLD